jgi:hypothetical protein
MSNSITRTTLSGNFAGTYSASYVEAFAFADVHEIMCLDRDGLIARLGDITYTGYTIDQLSDSALQTLIIANRW